MPVYIAGMHRSGTSMVTQRLHQSGLYLGHARHLMTATTDNPEGYWEHLKFVNLNDEILREFGGTWDVPPTFPPELDQDARFQRLKGKAESLLRKFAGHEPWGWKDPRNSLTLPFWSRVLPPFKVIVCLRNPYEVYLSLRERRYCAHPLGLTLWRIYHQAILDYTTPQQRLITHYDAHFQNPQAELQRILDFLGLPAQAASFEPSTTRPTLRHYHHRTGELKELGVKTEVLDLYESLCREANYAEPVMTAEAVNRMSSEKRYEQASGSRLS